jgi:hypothetical protein
MAHRVSGDGAGDHHGTPGRSDGRRTDAADPSDLDDLPSALPSLDARRPGQFAIGELLRVHQTERTRSRWARLFGASPVGVEVEPWFEAAVGELFVGDLLSELGEEWAVFHSVPVGISAGAPSGAHGGDLDHLVIGPAGCFTVTVRNHPGLDIAVSGRTVLVAGAKVSYVRDAEHDLGRAERLLGAALGGGLSVTGILVFVEPKALTSRQIPRDLEVLSSSELLPWLAARPEVFDATEVERIAGAAEQRKIWGDAALVADDGASARREFDGLRRAVDRSRMLRQLWFGIVTMVSIVTATAIATLAIINLAPGGSAH